MTTSDESAPKRPGPKSRAAIEAELREKLEAEMREKIEADVRAEYERKEQEAREIREATAAVTPITGADISADPQAPEAVTIHFVEDGFTVLGKVWYRGENLTLAPGTNNWDLSIVPIRKGSAEKKCFALFDEDEQIEKWGKRFFRNGPWKGARLDQITEINEESLSEAERAQLRKAQQLHDEKYGVKI